MYKFIKVHFIGTVFVEIGFVAFIISLHVITELPVILPKCLPHSEVHVLGFQK